MRNFYRNYKNVRIKVGDGMIFRCCEDFTDRFENVPMSGMNYMNFGHDRIAPFTANTRVYSCILLDNNYYPMYKWRGRYNEDTDLSLRFLKDGYCTILFHAFLAGKMATMSMKGGNTDKLYIQDKESDGRLQMAKSLESQHGDVTKVKRKWGRWQHSVDYRPFEDNIFKLKVEYQNLIQKVNEYGMKLYKDDKLIDLISKDSIFFEK